MRKAQRKPLAVTGALFTSAFAVALLGIAWAYLDAHCYFLESVRHSRCLGHLALVDKGKVEYGSIHSLTNGASVTAQDFIELVDGGWPILACPGGGSYTVGTLGEKPSCSLHGAAP